LEISAEELLLKWKTHVNGGDTITFYYHQKLVVRWDAVQGTFPGYIGHPGRETDRPASVDLYFRPGITWPLRAASFSPQPMQVGSVFSVRWYAIVSDCDDLIEIDRRRL
jgi:hypothetical protein